MGGSSLAPEVLRQVLGVAPGYPRFRMLDSVDPDAVRAALQNAATSLFILASKSGSTIEPNVMAAEARRTSRRVGCPALGVAIRGDHRREHRAAPARARRAVPRDFRQPVGHRRPLLGAVALRHGARRADGGECRRHPRPMRGRWNRPAASTTVTRESRVSRWARSWPPARQSGRDKLTLLLPKPLASFGLWVEQLVAESTGKQGKGIVPITGEVARCTARIRSRDRGHLVRPVNRPTRPLDVDSRSRTFR